MRITILCVALQIPALADANAASPQICCSLQPAYLTTRLPEGEPGSRPSDVPAQDTGDQDAASDAPATVRYCVNCMGL